MSSDPENLFILSGITNTKNIAVKDKTVTIAVGALNGSNVMLTSTNGYNLKLAKNVPIVTDSTSGYTLVNGNTIIYPK